jgi:hypothetical protein
MAVTISQRLQPLLSCTRWEGHLFEQSPDPKPGIGVLDPGMFRSARAHAHSMRAVSTTQYTLSTLHAFVSASMCQCSRFRSLR